MAYSRDTRPELPDGTRTGDWDLYEEEWVKFVTPIAEFFSMRIVGWNPCRFFMGETPISLSTKFIQRFNERMADE